MDLKDKEYFSVAGETESNAPKSMYSLAQIFLLSLGVTLLPRATAILRLIFKVADKNQSFEPPRTTV